jgi:hypothetical protein
LCRLRQRVAAIGTGPIITRHWSKPGASRSIRAVGLLLVLVVVLVFRVNQIENEDEHEYDNEEE